MLSILQAELDRFIAVSFEAFGMASLIFFHGISSLRQPDPKPRGENRARLGALAGPLRRSDQSSPGKTSDMSWKFLHRKFSYIPMQLRNIHAHTPDGELVRFIGWATEENQLHARTPTRIAATTAITRDLRAMTVPFRCGHRSECGCPPHSAMSPFSVVLGVDLPPCLLSQKPPLGSLRNSSGCSAHGGSADSPLRYFVGLACCAPPDRAEQLPPERSLASFACRDEERARNACMSWWSPCQSIAADPQRAAR